MISRPLLIIDGKAPDFVPVYPLPGRDRDERPLYVLERTVLRKTPHGWQLIPRGYVTDFASIPGLATIISCFRLQPLGPWAWDALSHDFGYAVGEPGYRPVYDDIFRQLMAVDRVGSVARTVMYGAVHLFGQGGYDAAPSWWSSENFADPDTGEYPVKPPFAREDAFIGGRFGLRAQPDWPDLAGLGIAA